MHDADREVLAHFVNTRNRTIELLGLVPEEWLGRCAEGEDCPVNWLFRHIADGPDWWMTHCIQDGQTWRYFGNGPFDRATLARALQSSRDRVVAFFQAGGDGAMQRVYELVPEKSEGEGRWTGRNRLLYLADHEVHHRGKIVLALRQWGLNELPFMP